MENVENEILAISNFTLMQNKILEESNSSKVSSLSSFAQQEHNRGKTVIIGNDNDDLATRIHNAALELGISTTLAKVGIITAKALGFAAKYKHPYVITAAIVTSVAMGVIKGNIEEKEMERAFKQYLGIFEEEKDIPDYIASYSDKWQKLSDKEEEEFKKYTEELEKAFYLSTGGNADGRILTEAISRRRRELLLEKNKELIDNEKKYYFTQDKNGDWIDLRLGMITAIEEYTQEQLKKSYSELWKTELADHFENISMIMGKSLERSLIREDKKWIFENFDLIKIRYEEVLNEKRNNMAEAVTKTLEAQRIDINQEPFLSILKEVRTGDFELAILRLKKYLAEISGKDISNLNIQITERENFLHMQSQNLSNQIESMDQNVEERILYAQEHKKESALLKKKYDENIIIDSKGKPGFLIKYRETNDVRDLYLMDYSIGDLATYSLREKVDKNNEIKFNSEEQKKKFEEASLRGEAVKFLLDHDLQPSREAEINDLNIFKSSPRDNTELFEIYKEQMSEEEKKGYEVYFSKFKAGEFRGDIPMQTPASKYSRAAIEGTGLLYLMRYQRFNTLLPIPAIKADNEVRKKNLEKKKQAKNLTDSSTISTREGGEYSSYRQNPVEMKSVTATAAEYVNRPVVLPEGVTLPKISCPVIPLPQASGLNCRRVINRDLVEIFDTLKERLPREIV